jgi:2-polyprenyl-3-methyl-5-hydroxy-6-metoxy-1,4-benzoquinol methylase
MQRIIAISSILEEFRAKRIADFGCGDGKLVNYLCKNSSYKQIFCVDLSSKKIAKIYKKYFESNVVTCINQSFFDYNKVFNNLDAIILSEVIEHFDMEKVFVLLNLILSNYKPKILIITTPNRSYNKELKTLNNGLRHSSHVFELTEEELTDFIFRINQIYIDYYISSGFFNDCKASHIIVLEKR